MTINPAPIPRVPVSCFIAIIIFMSGGWKRSICEKKVVININSLVELTVNGVKKIAAVDPQPLYGRSTQMPTSVKLSVFDIALVLR